MSLHSIAIESDAFQTFKTLLPSSVPMTSCAADIYDVIDKSDRRISDYKDFARYTLQLVFHEFDIAQCMPKDAEVAVRFIFTNSSDITSYTLNVETAVFRMLAAFFDYLLLLSVLHRVFVSVIYKSGYLFFMIRNLAEVVYLTSVPGHHIKNGIIVAFLFNFLARSLVFTGIGILDCVYILWGSSTVFWFLKNQYSKSVENFAAVIRTNKNAK